MLSVFKPEDIDAIVPQDSQSLNAAGRARIVDQAVPRGPCWTARNGEGRIIAVGGFVFTHAGWATAWTILAKGIGAAMPGLTRAVRAELAAVQAARVDMHVDPESVASIRWAMMLDFQLEAVFAAALPDGRDMGIWRYEGMKNGRS